MKHVFEILLIYALFSQNFIVAIYALFPQIFLGWKAESAKFCTFRMYELIYDLLENMVVSVGKLIDKYPRLESKRKELKMDTKNARTIFFAKTINVPLSGIGWAVE